MIMVEMLTGPVGNGRTKNKPALRRAGGQVEGLTGRANRCPLPLPGGSLPGSVLETGHHDSLGFGLPHYDLLCTRFAEASCLVRNKIQEIFLQGLCPLHPHKPFEKGLTENFQFCILSNFQ